MKDLTNSSKKEAYKYFEAGEYDAIYQAIVKEYGSIERLDALARLHMFGIKTYNNEHDRTIKREGISSKP